MYKNQRGFAALGIIALVVITGGLFAVTKLASNPDLTFFNLGEYAKVSEEEQCGGCVDGYRLKWNKTKQRCLRTVTASCNPIVKPKPTPQVGIGTNECASCKSDGDCLEGLVCLNETVTCLSLDCPTPKPGTCVRRDGSSKCGTKTTPKPSPNTGVPATFETAYVWLKADDFLIYANGKTFGKKMANLQVRSDPNDSGDPNYTTLEASWNENGTEMRLYMYFHKDNEKWWMSEMRIYNGKNPGDWLTVVSYPNGTGPDTPTFIEPQPNYSAKLGQAYKANAGYLFMNGDVVLGNVNFGNMELLPFRKKIIIEPPKPSPTPVSKSCGCRGNYLICDITKDQIVDKIEYCSGGCEVLATTQDGPGGLLPPPMAVCKSGSVREKGQMCQANSECKSNSCISPTNLSGLSLGTLDLGKICQ